MSKIIIKYLLLDLWNKIYKILTKIFNVALILVFCIIDNIKIAKHKIIIEVIT